VKQALKRAWTVARLDLAVWRRTPWAIAAALIPPLGMALLVTILTASVTKQPVALVVEGTGPQAQTMANIIEADHEAYSLKVTDARQAAHLLATQAVAAVIVVPTNFDTAVADGRGSIGLTLNNVDIDFGDDIRRAVDRSVAEFDAPSLGASLQRAPRSPGLVVPNPYRVDVAERTTRRTNVSYVRYQIVPVVLLLILNVGVVGGALVTSRDHERGTVRTLRLAPLHSGEVIAGRFAGMAVVTTATLVPVMAGLALSGVISPPAGHWLPLIALLGASIVLAAGIGAAVGSIVRRPSLVAVVAVIVSSYLFFLGGGLTTVAFLPGWLQTVSLAVPTRYAIDGLHQTLFYPDLRGVAGDLAAIAAFAVGGLGAGTLAQRRLS
jgi:ABC-2 type transport system permease protein